MFVTETNNN